MRHYEYECTCSACPHQFDVWEGDTKVAYIRYRWGYLAVYPYKPDKFEHINEWTGKKSIKQEIDWETIIYDADLGDDYDGILEDEEKTLDVIDEKIWEYYERL